MTDTADLQAARVKAFEAWQLVRRIGVRQWPDAEVVQALLGEIIGLEDHDCSLSEAQTAVALLPTPTVGEGWQELAELSAKATAGPWEALTTNGQAWLTADDGETGIAYPGNNADAAFIVAAVNYVRSALSASPREGGST